MVNHLKRLASPQTWSVNRKSSKYIVKPRGYTESAMPVAVLIREVLRLAQNRREVNKMVQSNQISLDGKIVKDDKLPVGLMSVLHVNTVGDFRMLLNKHGNLFLRKLDSKESKLKLGKIISKTILRGNKLQIGLHDGRTFLTDNKDVKVNDTVVLTLPEFKVNSYLKLEKNAKIYLTGGSNVGNIGTVENISESVIVKIDDEVVEAYKENVFVIGKDTELISLK